MKSVAHRFLSFWLEVCEAGLLIVAIGSVLLVLTPSAHAAQTTPYKINYQGRLTNSGGTALTTGSYNMKFRLFSVGSGGSAVWSETRDASTQRVTVTNGQFNVQLGDVTALTPSVFTSQPLYLEVELPTPATATCSTAGCASWTEGAMTPRQTLASAAYAMNADTVDGIDGVSLARVDTANTYTATNLFKNSVDSSNAFTVQKADGTALFAIDTSGGTVTVGPPGASTTYGKSTVGATTDTGNAGSYTMVRYLSGAQGGTSTTASAYIGSSLDGVNNKYKIGVYTDSAGSPQILLATSTEGTVANGWVTTPITVPISPNTYYWIAYMTSTSTSTLNNLNYDTGGTSCAGTATYASGFPAFAPSCTAGTKAYSMYVTLAGVPALTVLSSGKVGIGTTSPSTSLEVDGTVLFQPTADSNNAFQLNNAAAASLFVADTTNLRIQIGSATADANGVVLVLDTKNTAGDPFGVNGAMYYNSNLGKFRCYENSAWANCITAAAPQTVVTLASDVANTGLTIADVTGLSFAVTSGKTYHFSALINYTSAATTTGSLWTVNGPSQTSLSFTSTYTLTATSQTVNYAAAYNLPAAANASSLTTGNIAKIDGIVTPSANGTVVIRFASEVAGSAITAKAGSTLTWW